MPCLKANRGLPLQRLDSIRGWVLDWITRQPLRREWFFEERDGNCRLMGSFAVRLSETVIAWRRAVAPVAEWVAREFWKTIRRPDAPLATRLTQSKKRQAKGASIPPTSHAPLPQNVCDGCGRAVAKDSIRCATCAVKVSRSTMLEVSRQGRIASKSLDARARVAATQRRQQRARYSWQPSSQPQWLTEEVYAKQIQPILKNASLSQIASAINVSIMYASDIRRGRRRPHPRHWRGLAGLVGIVGD
jgi:hypothetical protein